jgi:hypothetical protein
MVESTGNDEPYPLDPLPSAPLLRTLSFGAAGASFAILLAISQIGANDFAMKVAVLAAAVDIPVGVLIGILCDLMPLVKRDTLREWAASKGMSRTMDLLAGFAMLGPSIAIGFLLYHMDGKRTAVVYVVVVIASYVYLAYSAWRLDKINQRKRREKRK